MSLVGMLQQLAAADVRFVVVGGVAARLHGSAEGDIDLLHRVEPIGDYAACVAHSVVEEAFGVALPTLQLGPLIRAKRHADRPKDHQALPELEAMAVKRGEWPITAG